MSNRVKFFLYHTLLVVFAYGSSLSWEEFLNKPYIKLLDASFSAIIFFIIFRFWSKSNEKFQHIPWLHRILIAILSFLVTTIVFLVMFTTIESMV